MTDGKNRNKTNNFESLVLSERAEYTWLLSLNFGKE